MSRKGPGPITRAIERQAALAVENVRRVNRHGRRKQPYSVEPMAGAAVRIVNHRGQAFLIDTEDWLQFSQCRFAITVKGAVSMWGAAGDCKQERLSRVLMKPASGHLVDHKNGDPSDNRRSNLRVCSPRQNAWNMRLTSLNTSGFKGVSLQKSGRFKACSTLNGRPHYLGMFPTAGLAAHAYDAFARKAFGQFACVNFPLEGEQSVHRNIGSL